MKRRKFIQISGASLSLVPFLGISQEKKDYQITTLRKDVGIFTSRGGTIAWHYNDDNIVIIDTQFPDSASKLKAEIQAKTSRKIDLLVNTHHHGDHSGGNKTLSDLVLNSVAHVNSVKNQKNTAIARNKEGDQFYPTTTFEKSWSKDLSKETVSLHYFGAGHTDGDSVVHFEQTNIAHMGDLMFNGRHPFIDKSAGASISNWIDLLDKVQEKFDSETLFIFGHAQDPANITGGKTELKQMQQYLETVMSTVQDGLDAGKSIEAIQDIKSFKGFESYSERGIQRSLNAALIELDKIDG